MNNIKRNIVSGLLVFGLSSLFSQWNATYKGCDVQDSDFTLETLLNSTTDPTIQGPVQFTFDEVQDQNGNVDVDIYFVQRYGEIKRLKAGSSQVELLGKLDVNITWDHGLTGIALDPNFKTNNWIYMWNSPPVDPVIGLTGIGHHMHLSRFTLKGNQIDMATEKIIYSKPSNAYWVNDQTAIWHQGGPMTFDGEGNLWVVWGNNSWDHRRFGGDSTLSDEWGAGNTASTRGSVFRIKPIAFPDNQNPEPGIGKTYTVPSGGFGDYFADYWESQGNQALAAEYRDPTKVLPELYVKGMRSVFSVTVDPYTNWVGWGEINTGSGWDDWYLAKNPTFSGFPWFQGLNDDGTQRSLGDHSYNINNIENNSPLQTGVNRLPISEAQTLTMGFFNDKIGGGRGQWGGSAISGPVYHYNGQLKSTRMWPPQYNGLWFLTDYTDKWRFAVVVDSSGPAITYQDAVQLFPGVNMGGSNFPLDMHFGPDNALYILDYGTRSVEPAVGNGSIYRWSYNQTCTDPTLLPPVTPVLHSKGKTLDFHLSNNLLQIKSKGFHHVTLYSLQGKIIWQAKGEGVKDYFLERHAGLNSGMYFISVKTPEGNFFENVISGLN